MLKCGKVGHREDSCPTHPLEENIPSPQLFHTRQQGPIVATPANKPECMEDFKSWMLVKKPPRKKNSKSNNSKSMVSGNDKPNDPNTDSGSGQFKPEFETPAPSEHNDNLGKDANHVRCNAPFSGLRFQILAENMEEDFVADCAPVNKEDELGVENAAAQDSLIGEDMEVVSINNLTTELGNNLRDSPEALLASTSTEDIVKVPCMETMCEARAPLAPRSVRPFPKPHATRKAMTLANSAQEPSKPTHKKSSKETLARPSTNAQRKVTFLTSQTCLLHTTIKYPCPCPASSKVSLNNLTQPNGILERLTPVHFRDPPNPRETYHQAYQGELPLRLDDIQNVQGGSRDFLLTLKELLRNYKPTIALLETRISGERADEVCNNIGFDGKFRIEAQGFSRGIWMFWKARIPYGEDGWLFTAIYGSPQEAAREKLWTLLETFVSTHTKPWLLVGDFNETRSMAKRQNYGSELARHCVKFDHWINNNEFIDLGFLGPEFTWSQGLDPNTRELARLDRGLCNDLWRMKFEESGVHHLLKNQSDHYPLLISPNGFAALPHTSKPFRFQVTWTSH
ncbi:hypothetical protein Cgig2_009096 [Carnegiea gigantea]|uniref:CCHC-type domain-containing protein n=1 Tax=Carnegiea gigantea TaxID=171969 RepID=A0A9Q1QGB3_9CARY|nr:hypothetical protein Cgig2_009096 [Carnegiea gigantea]